METSLQRLARPFKALLPGFLWRPLRGLATAVLTPMRFSLESGHFKSSIQRLAVSRTGAALPWYTYPCIQFLTQRDFTWCRVLEFGGGQSTLWWAAHAKSVVTFEEDPAWHGKLAKSVPGNVALHRVAAPGPQASMEFVRAVLGRTPDAKFDVIIIDGLYRNLLIPVAVELLSERGAIVCDNAEGYGFYEATRELGFARVDFFGYAPGIVLPHATSVFFRPGCFLFDAKVPIPVIAKSP